MLGQLAGQDETDRSLNFPRSHSGLLVVTCQGSSFDCDLLEDVSDEGVQNRHSFGGDPSVGVNLLQHLLTSSMVLDDAITERLTDTVGAKH